MTNVFVTFSPSPDIWDTEATWYMYLKTIVDIAKPYAEHYYGTTSWGDAGTHYHFHLHLVGCDATAKTLRKRILRRMAEDLNYPDEGYIFRFERQKGKMTDARKYIDENNLQVNADDPEFYVPISSKSEDYDKCVDTYVEIDKVLSAGEFFVKFLRECEKENIRQGGLDSWLINNIFDRISHDYFLYRIPSFQIECMINDMCRKYDRRYKYQKLV